MMGTFILIHHNTTININITYTTTITKQTPRVNYYIYHHHRSYYYNNHNTKYVNNYTIAINTIYTNNTQQGPHNLSLYTLLKQDILMLYPLIPLSPSLGTSTCKYRWGQEHTIDICVITVLSRYYVVIH